MYTSPNKEVVGGGDLLNMEEASLKALNSNPSCGIALRFIPGV